MPEKQRDPAQAAVPARATLLDPRRPARDLLEHLLDGIASCHLIFAEYADDDLDDDDLDDLDVHDVFEDTGDGGDQMSDVDEDENGDGERGERVAAEFADIVRDQADATSTRLTEPARRPGSCSGFRLGMSHRRA